MLKKDEFIKAIQDAIQEKNEDLEIQTRSAVKNNDIETSYLDIRYPESFIAPTFKVDSLYEAYESGEDIDRICDRIISIVNSNGNNMGIDTDEIFSIDYFKEHVITRLINSQKNYGLLLNAPYKAVKGFDDLVLIGRIEVLLPEGTRGTILVTEDILNRVGIPAKEMFEMAQENTERLYPAVIQTMAETISEITGLPVSEFNDAPPMYVVTNNTKSSGATVLTYNGVIDQIRSVVGDDFYILPSSVNEVLAISRSYCDGFMEGGLNDMVRDVNANVVPPDDVLSDNVYVYDSENRAISTCYSESKNIELENENMFDMDEDYELI